MINPTVQLIEKQLVEFCKTTEDLFLGRGKLASALYLYKYGIVLNDKNIINKGLTLFENIYLTFEERVNDPGSLNFIEGWGGFAWMYQYLINNNVIEKDTELVSYLDNIFIEYCRSHSKANNYDLFYGIVGVGVYFLERSRDANCNNANQYLIEITDILIDLSQKRSKGITWLVKSYEDGTTVVDLSMSHGINSIISFLTKVYEKTKYEEAAYAATDAINWLLQFRKSDKKYSCFPKMVYIKEGVTDYVTDEYISRLAWCYGDLGIGYSIFTSGVRLKNKEFTDQGLTILDFCAQRMMGDAFVGVVDKGFCHGTSGIFYIFNKLITKYNKSQFVEIRNYWLDKSILNEGENVQQLYACGMKDGEKTYIPEYGIVEGYAGIGLALLAFKNNINDTWDEIFML